MKKFLKITGITLVLVFILLLVLPILFKGKIIQVVKEQADANLNAKLEFSDLSLSLIRNFPSLSLKIDNLSLKGIDEFDKDTLISFNSFQTSLNLASVLFGDEIEIKSILLDKPVINAIVLENGKANWDITKPDTTAVADTTTSTTKFKIGFKKFEIRDGFIRYNDLEGKMSAQIDSLNFLLKGDLTESQTILSISSSIAKLNFNMEGIPYLSNAKVAFKSDLDANLDSSVYTFKENEISLNEIQAGFDGKISMPKEDIGFDLTFFTKETAFKPVLSLIPAIYMTDFDGIETSGNFILKGYVKGIYNDSILPAFGVDLKIENAMFKYPDLPKSVNNINVIVKVDNKGGTGDDNLIDIKKAHAEIAGNPIDAVMFVSTTAADVDMSGNIKARLDLESIKDVVPLDSITLKGIMDASLDMKGKLSSIEKEKYDEFKADGYLGLANFEFSSSDLPSKVGIPSAFMKFSPAYMSLEKLDVNIGKSDMHMIGRLDNIFQYVFKDSTLVGRFNFTSAYLDAADLMGSEETTTTSSSETAPEDTAALTAFEIPGNIDFLMKSKLDKIKYDNLNISNLTGDIILKDSKAGFKGVNMNLLEGNMGMNGFYDAKNVKQPKVDFDLKIKDFSIPAAFEAFNTVKQLAPVAKNSKGKFSLDFKFDSDLDYNLNPKYETLNGNGRLQSKEIGMKNSDAMAKLASLTKWKALDNPVLKDVDLKFKIVNGNLTIDPAKMKLGKSELEFGGTQNINKDIKYDIGFNIPRAELGETVNTVVDNLIAKTGKEIKLAENIKIDVVAEGKVDDPKFRLKGSKGEEGGVKQEIKKGLSEEAKKIIEEADKQAQAIIDKAKTEADKIRDEAKKAGDNLIKEADNQGDKLKEEAGKKGKDLIAEADKKGQELIDKATNPITKAAAKKSAELMHKEAVAGADKLKKEADNSATKLHNEAQLKADKLNQEANSKADALVAKAEAEAQVLKDNANKKVEKM
ncbi:MAG: AsmA-like C-terminal region-containing protein [Bacteroidales bacterium]